MVPELQETIVYGTRRDVQLEHCIVPNDPISPQNPKMIWITMLLRSTTPQNLMSPSSSYQEFPGFYALHQHRKAQHGIQIGSGNRDVNLEHMNEDQSLRKELRSCQHFLVNSELESARHKLFNYAVEALNETIVNEKLDHFRNNLKCAAKEKLAFSFILINIQDGRFRYFYAHKNSALLDRSKLVCTDDDLSSLKDFLNKTDPLSLLTEKEWTQNEGSTSWPT